MKIDDSNKNFSIIIAGILAVVVLSVFVAFASGFGGYHEYKQNNSQPFNLYPINSTENLSNDNNGNNKIVSVAQSRRYIDVDTATGSISIVDDEHLPTEIPLCINANVIKGWWVTVKSIGGYKPYDGWYVGIYQGKPCKKLIGCLGLTWTEVPSQSGCCYTVYNITFVMKAGCCIHVDSNHFPDVPQDWDLQKNVPNTPDLKKEVDLKFVTNWYGCGEEDQRFEIILIQKNYISGVPNSRIKN